MGLIDGLRDDSLSCNIACSLALFYSKTIPHKGALSDILYAGLICISYRRLFGLHHAAHATHSGSGHCGGRGVLFLVGDNARCGEEHAGD